MTVGYNLITKEKRKSHLFLQLYLNYSGSLEWFLLTPTSRRHKMLIGYLIMEVWVRGGHCIGFECRKKGACHSSYEAQLRTGYWCFGIMAEHTSI